MKKIGIKYVLVMALSVFLLIVISPKTQAAIGANIIPENITRSGQNAWRAISDFMGEVWYDTTRIASSFFEKTLGDAQAVITQIAEILKTARERIVQLAPQSLIRAVAAIWDFFAQISRFITDLIENGFSALKPPTRITQ